ncbi:type VII toxin-antitoxin system HepT family RNase toxin [Heliophilum fasciatum]|uniref:Uncharacterized protein YutE (UPF0331/DUF86 family) n=1 Tax=Heliophilum fasciatum TaxID=35700 RepID=A0A4R2RJP0_9FIRM|nr:DUF86 domain-containing protein [Heliophilum fasciatum]MCW2278843.1 uncharacterized protein YutE (UPF0331/DUF86 family) [Heliophilum fasciatum]TCP64072.1 uncharacterized protein YutE (UPF0331/DUF86 family) [Heliophilum fasciatum]
MVEGDKLRTKLNYIQKNVEELEIIKHFSYQEFLEKPFCFAASLRYLQVAIEAMTDVVMHIIARERIGLPQHHGHAVELLVQKGIFSSEFGLTLRKMIRFRNRIVHIYDEVDERSIYEVIQSHLQEFHEFVDIVSREYLREV